MIFVSIILKWFFFLSMHIGQSLRSLDGVGVEAAAIFSLQSIIHEMDHMYLDY